MTSDLLLFTVIESDAGAASSTVVITLLYAVVIHKQRLILSLIVQDRDVITIKHRQDISTNQAAPFPMTLTNLEGYFSYCNLV